MHIDYSDIWSRIPTPPLWWFQGVPRYEPFDPEWMDGSEAALVHSKCQVCGTDFMVGICSRYANHPSLSEEIQKHNTLWLSNPPKVFCCQGGHATSSLAIEVLEFWRRGTGGDYKSWSTWSRVPEFENKLSDWYPEITLKPLPNELLSKVWGPKPKVEQSRNRMSWTSWLRR
jgi:hypothetical protein